MVKITLEFKSVDEAIVALGKLAGAPSAPSKGAAGEGAQAPATDAPAVRTRKPRSDAGQKREPYKPRQQETGVSTTATAGGPSADRKVESGTTDAGKGAEQATNPTATTADSPAAPATATRAEAQAALEALVSGVNLDAGIKLLAEFGTQRLRDLPDEKLGEFVAKAKAALPKAPA